MTDESSQMFVLIGGNLHDQKIITAVLDIYTDSSPFVNFLELPNPEQTLQRTVVGETAR